MGESDVTVFTREERHLRKHLGDLIVAVRRFGVIFDQMMMGDKTERGKEAAKLMNAIDHANDSALYFGLGFDHRKDHKRNGTNEKAIQKHARRRWKE